MKSALWRKEKRKWTNFVRGMAADSEQISLKTDVTAGVSVPGDEDLTSQLIRDEAIKTWKLGLQLGISSQGNDDKMVEQLMTFEMAERKDRESEKAKNVNLS